ncbi:uncharacterized protein [Macrobrachium rosenbergii]|uniref:uncharacterized protein n=1 Tax=Macrobrachium rosenbergii TaxID=79674 RepID=UPI0034D50514
MRCEFEENEKVRKHEKEMAEIRLEMARLTGSDNLVSSPNPAFPERFNMSAALKLVPVFDEANVPEFFRAFERVASRLSWPADMWTLLIQCRLVGKAIKVYNALDEVVARDYHKVKSIVLKAYDLVPEAYQLKFRNSVKTSAVSFVEFARMKQEQFDDWMKSRQIVSLSGLRELILMEEFKKTCSKELRVYLEEVKAVEVSQAAQIADEFVLTHKSEYQNDVRSVGQYKTMGNNESRGPRVDNDPLTFNNGNRRFNNNRKFNNNNRNAGNKSSLSNVVEPSGNYVVLSGFPNTVLSAPLVEVRLKFPGYDRLTELAVVDVLPVPGIDGILGNDMLDAEGREIFPILSVHAYPVAVTTRAAARAANLIQEDNGDDLLLNSLEVDVERPGSVDSSGGSTSLKPDWDRSAFINAQKQEFNFELGDDSDLTKPKFILINSLLYRLSRPTTDNPNQTTRIEQIVVPSHFRDFVLNIAHQDSFSGHFGIGKTFQKLAESFWWPGLKSSVKKFVKECEICQVMGKPNQLIPKAPLNPIPAIGEPFSEIVVDVVGPLPKTKSGCMYMLTVVDRASRFPEAFPLRWITSRVVFEKLIDYFSRYGLPRIIQTDCGTNFTSKEFRSKCAELAIQHITSVPYHPESQGVVERFHQTLKSILKKHCYEQGDEWDKALPFALFALRNHPNVSTGVAPFELVLDIKLVDR